MQVAATDEAASIKFAQPMHFGVRFKVNVFDSPYQRNLTKEAGIPNAVHHTIPLHSQHVFANLALKEGVFPIAKVAAKRELSLPISS